MKRQGRIHTAQIAVERLPRLARERIENRRNGGQLLFGNIEAERLGDVLPHADYFITKLQKNISGDPGAEGGKDACRRNRIFESW
jgi:hypothetical protein